MALYVTTLEKHTQTHLLDGANADAEAKSARRRVCFIIMVVQKTFNKNTQCNGRYALHMVDRSTCVRHRRPSTTKKGSGTQIVVPIPLFQQGC